MVAIFGALTGALLGAVEGRVNIRSRDVHAQDKHGRPLYLFVSRDGLTYDCWATPGQTEPAPKP